MQLGWGPGLVALVAAGLVTFWSAKLVAEMCEFGGKRHTRYRDVAGAILGTQHAHVVSSATYLLVSMFGTRMHCTCPPGS